MADAARRDTGTRFSPGAEPSERPLGGGYLACSLSCPPSQDALAALDSSLVEGPDLSTEHLRLHAAIGAFCTLRWTPRSGLLLVNEPPRVLRLRSCSTLSQHRTWQAGA